MNLDNYLIQAKIEELEKTFEAEGYKIVRPPKIGNSLFSMVALKHNVRHAVVVRVDHQIQDSVRKLSQLRSVAQRHGARFQLAVVHPPREIEVEIEGFEETLTNWLMDHMPPELDEISGNTRIESVSDIEYDSIHIKGDGVHISGTASVSVELEFGGGEAKDGMTSSDSFPLDFDVVLDAAAAIEHANEIRADTSAWYE